MPLFIEVITAADNLTIKGLEIVFTLGTLRTGNLRK